MWNCVEEVDEDEEFISALEAAAVVPADKRGQDLVLPASESHCQIIWKLC